MELDEDFPDINAAPHIRFERFDRDDDLIIEFDNMFSNNGKQDNLLLTLNQVKCIICIDFNIKRTAILFQLNLSSWFRLSLD